MDCSSRFFNDRNFLYFRHEFLESFDRRRPKTLVKHSAALAGSSPSRIYNLAVSRLPALSMIRPNSFALAMVAVTAAPDRGENAHSTYSCFFKFDEGFIDAEIIPWMA
jgi:hypothetical protein